MAARTLAVACAAAFAGRLVAAFAVHAPWIMVDELIYRRLAGSLADGAGFTVRGHSLGLDSLYPLLLAGIWRVAGGAAYDVTKIVDVLLLTALAPIVFVWGRRVASQRSALVAALLTLLLPAFVYSGELMTENLFLPLFVLAAFAISAAIAEPTPRRQTVALAAVALACSVRVQGVVLVPIWATAVALSAVLAPLDRRRRLTRELLRHRVAGVVVGLAAVTFGLAALARGGHALGFYEAILDTHYDLGAVVVWTGAHAAALALACGFVPAYALVATIVRARREALPSETRALVAITAATAAWLVAGAGVWAAPHGDGVRGRYVMYAVPLLLLVLAVHFDRASAHLRRRRLPIAAVCCLAPAALPLGRLLGSKVLSDDPSLTPLYWLHRHASLGTAELALALACCIAFAAVLAGARPAQLVLVAAILAVDSAAASSLAADQSARVARGVDTSSWVDDALPGGGGAAFLLTGNVEPMQLWQTEFWNDGLDRVYTLGTTEPGSLPSQTARVDPATGRLSAGGRSLATSAVVTDTSVELDGRVLARSTNGLTLFAYGADTRVEQAFAGLYPDSWTKPSFSYTRPACSGVTRLVFAFRSSPSAGVQRVVVRQDGTVVADERTAGGEQVFVRAPLDAARGSCTLRFRVTPWSPAQRQPGSADTRELGLLYERAVVLP